ncbi:MAG: site-specific integrase [Eubacteriales bacterium]
MPAYKDKQMGTWYAKFYSKNWKGENKQIKKRGFATKKAALDYERNYKLRQEGALDISFEEFFKIYTEDKKNRLKRNTWISKEYIVRKKILPYFGNLKMKEIMFWTREEYQLFSKAIMDKDVSYYAFEMLYWTGVRIGELMALTMEDFDFQKQTVRINKSYQRIEGEDVITSPKTPKSVRTINIPKFLVEEMKEYFAMLYKYKKDDRIFQISKSFLHHEMDRGSKSSGVKRIRIHGLRHSHISLLIELGFSALAIADRVGHESIEITYRYAHLFPSKQIEMALKLDMEKNEMEGDYGPEEDEEKENEKCIDLVSYVAARG